jgi:hypothetical protein
LNHIHYSIDQAAAPKTIVAQSAIGDDDDALADGGWILSI